MGGIGMLGLFSGVGAERKRRCVQCRGRGGATA